MEIPDGHETWREAAARRDLVFYRPSDPRAAAFWAGGHGRDGDLGARRTTHLGVHARISGCEVVVDTWSHRNRFPKHWLVQEALDALVIEQRDSIELPWTVEVVAETRTIAVDGVATAFEGVRAVGGRSWAGVAPIGDVTVKVTTHDPVVVMAIERCDDLLLPDFEPGR